MSQTTRSNFLKLLGAGFSIVAVYTLFSIAVAGTDKEESKATTRTPASDIKWKELPGGRALANVKGDLTKGAHLKLVRFDAGVKTAPHIHSHSYTGVMVTGTGRHYEPGKPETETILPPGSVWRIPANTVHISECLPGSECIFATQSGGAFDFKLAK